MTMQELAKLANVSVSTVSKAFCDANDVSDETKQRIFEIAKEHGCYGHFYKGKYHKKVIALIVPELASNYYTRFAECLQKIIEKNNCMVVISSDHFSISAQAELIEYYSSYLKVDGIIVANLYRPLKKSHCTPLVALFTCADKSVDSIIVDWETSLTEAIHVLRNYGHKNIVFLGEQLTVGKVTSFQKLMGASGFFNPYTYQSSFRFEKAGQDGVLHLLEKDIPFTAIVCAYDNIAFGAMKELKKHGFSIPEDISIIGMDNIDMSQYTNTSLSSIGVNIEEFCAVVWDLLSKKIRKKTFYNCQQITLQGNLVLRESIADVKKGHH